MFPQIQSSRYPGASLSHEFFSKHFIVSPSTEYTVPLPVLVSQQCKHSCIHIFARDKFASIWAGRIFNPMSIFKDIVRAGQMLASKRLPFTYDNLVKVSSHIATEDVVVPIGVILFLPDERGIFYRFVLETYIASMYDLISHLHTHRCLQALLDLRVAEVTPSRMIVYFDQGII